MPQSGDRSRNEQSTTALAPHQFHDIFGLDVNFVVFCDYADYVPAMLPISVWRKPQGH